MKPNDLKEFASIMRMLNEAFVGKSNISPELVEVYFNILMRFDIEDVQRASNNIMQTWEFHFLPKPAHFIKEIEGTESDRSHEVWQDVIDQISRKGINNVKFDSDVMRAINAVGGLMAIGHCDVDKLQFKERSFLENYTVSVKTSVKAIENKRLKELVGGIG